MFSSLPLWLQFVASFSFMFLCAYIACISAFSNWFAVSLAVAITAAPGSLLYTHMRGLARLPAIALVILIPLGFLFLWVLADLGHERFDGFTTFNLISCISLPLFYILFVYHPSSHKFILPLCILATVLGISLGHWEISITGDPFAARWVAVGLFFIALGGFSPAIILGVLLGLFGLSQEITPRLMKNIKSRAEKRQAAVTGKNTEILKSGTYEGKDLIAALKKKQFDAAASLLEHQNSTWSTVFHNASEDDIKILLNKVSDKNKARALETAIFRENSDVLKVLVEDCNMDVKASSAVLLPLCTNNHNRTASEQEKNEYTTILKYLISKGADVNYYEFDEANIRGNTPLTIASEYNDIQKMEVLLQAGANPNGSITGNEDYFDYQAAVPLSEASSPEALALLIKAGADITVKRGKLLVAAAEQGHKEKVKIMLSSGQDISRVGADALTEAISHSHKDIAQMLLDAGADAGARSQMWEDKNAWSSSPFSQSLLRKDKELAEKLFSSVKDPKKRQAIRLMTAAYNGDANTVKQLLAEGVNPEADHIYDETPLNCSTDTNITQMLVKAGATK